MPSYMRFGDYQNATRKTAVYPGMDTTDGIVYCTLGVTGEAGEVSENVKKMLRNDHGILTDDRRLMIEDEMGDVLWYLAQLATQCGLSLEQIAQKNLEKLELRRQKDQIKSR